NNMRTGWMFTALVVVGLSRVVVQGQATNAVVVSTNTTKLSDSALMNLPLPSTIELRLTAPDTNRLDYVVSKTKIHVSGPLVRPLKAKSTSDFGHRVLNLFNPFSTEEPNVPYAATGPVNTRAWSTIVGYSPGRTAFPDGAHHEPPQLRLISVSTEKLP